MLRLVVHHVCDGLYGLHMGSKATHIKITDDVRRSQSFLSPGGEDVPLPDRTQAPVVTKADDGELSPGICGVIHKLIVVNSRRCVHDLSGHGQAKGGSESGSDPSG